MTFYDASYLDSAVRGKQQPVTGDKVLHEVARKHVKVLWSPEVRTINQ